MKSSPLNMLWGATLCRVDLDMVQQALVLTICVTGSSGNTLHSLECKGISELRFFSSIPGPWEYAEVTEIHSNTTVAGLTQLEIVLWSEDAGLTVVGDSVVLDGQKVGSHPE
jgi:hypothetical protein